MNAQFRDSFAQPLPARSHRLARNCVGALFILGGLVTPAWSALAATTGDSGIATAASTAAGNELFELEDDTTGAARGLAIFNATPPGRHAVRLHTQLGQAFTAPRTLSVSLPAGPRYEVVADAPMVHPSGSFTWVGHLQGYGDHYRVLITTGQGRSFGRILTPDGEFLLESDESGTTWLIDTQAAGLTHGRLADDIALPPVTTPRPQPPRRQLAPRMAPEPTEDPEISDVVQPQAAAQSTIDLLLLYTAGMVNRYGSGLQARLDQLVALGNQAYIDSQVNIVLRLVHTAQVGYSDTTANNTALDALTNGTDPTLANVGALRDQYGADLVALLRPFNNTVHISCGNGWLNGYNQQAVSLFAGYGYAVVSDGTDTGGSGYFCSDFSLTHELGHNMGSAHDRAHASYSGAYLYSYGYGVASRFGTIMSYINPEVGKFSSPNLTCTSSGDACGTVNDNNVRSLNNTRVDVANFRATTVVDKNSRLINIATRGWAGAGDSVMIAGFVISGTQPKKVLITAKGPVLATAGVPSVLADPNLTLYNSAGQPIQFNESWQSATNASEVSTLNRGMRSDFPQEAALLTTLNPGAYTAIVRGAGVSTGNALVEVFDEDPSSTSKLVNIATRGWAGTGDSVMIAGFVISGSQPKQVLITAKGPVLATAGVPEVLADPNLTLYNSAGQPIQFNENWQSASNANEVAALGRGMRTDFPQEAALLTTLAPGAYTAIVRGAGVTTGNALVEVFEE